MKTWVCILTATKIFYMWWKLEMAEKENSTTCHQHRTEPKESDVPFCLSRTCKHHWNFLCRRALFEQHATIRICDYQIFIWACDCIVNYKILHFCLMYRKHEKSFYSCASGIVSYCDMKTTMHRLSKILDDTKVLNKKKNLNMSTETA